MTCSQALRDEIDSVNELVFTDVNNGVYECGFAGSQDAYEQAYRKLFSRLDWLTERLSTQRYLVGDTITEADVRLFTTLARFDAVYHGHFKCNRSKLSEFSSPHIPFCWPSRMRAAVTVVTPMPSPMKRMTFFALRRFGLSFRFASTWAFARAR